MRTIAILGSTGSIGRQALEVIAAHRDRFRIVGLAAGRNADLLAAQGKAWGVERLALAAEEDDAAAKLAVETGADLVLNAVSGAAGLRASWATVDRGIDLAIANKESLVAAGPLLIQRAKETGAEILPVDSEHSAIFQCLRAGRRSELSRILLTASGGPFRGWPRADLATVTREEALTHPTWTMGQKITIDSATLMNKALEVIEAHVLFDLSPEEIDVVVHPESVVHSLVEFRDGSLIAHLGATDMRIPIQYALSHPERWEGPAREFSLTDLQAIHFEEVDNDVFPSICLAEEAIRKGGGAPAIMNAANEVAVARFLEGRIGFTQIFELVERALDQSPPTEISNLEDVLETDQRTRETVERWTC